MTAGAVAAGRPVRLVDRIPLRPAEGWLTLLATGLMVVVFPASLIDAGWIPSSAGDAGYLPWIAVAAYAIGVFGAKVGWGRWRTHLVGALFGGLVATLLMGGVAAGIPTAWEPRALAERVVAALGVAQEVWSDLVVAGKAQTDEYAHYHLVFGVLVWGAGLHAGYTVFGHRRPLDAVVVLGLATLANMALTQRDQLGLLVVFSAGALLLLIRTHVFEEEVTWARRRIGDPGVVGQLYLRGGAVFVTAAVLGSVLLTATASSKPLEGLWQDVPQHLQGLAEFVRRIAPPGGNPRPLGNIGGFGDTATTAFVWEPNDAVAFEAQFLRSEDRKLKWRESTFAEYTNFGWKWGPVRRSPVAARDIVFNDNFVFLDAPTPVGRREVQFRVRPVAFRYPTILAPNTVQWIDQPGEEIVVGQGGWITTLQSGNAADGYGTSAMIPVYQDIQGGITEARLRASPTDPADYTGPLAELFDIYTALPDGAVGPQLRVVLDGIEAIVASRPAAHRTTYDLVRTMEGYLADETNFAYSDDVRDEWRESCGDDVSTAECFAIIRQGYCELYASAMAVMLREADVPARVVRGFLPGERDESGLEVVRAFAAHMWVEVYFPDIGWVEFDPTGSVGQPQAIPSGSVGPATPRPSRPSPTFREPPTVPPNTNGGPIGGTGVGAGPFIGIALILVVGMVALVLAVLRRTPSKPMHPDQAWGSLGRLAARFGLGPRPSQTVYEYAGALGDVLPDARVELTTIARGKVEVAYGKRDLGNDRLRRIAEAYQRLRLALLSFVLRRGLRRRPRSG